MLGYLLNLFKSLNSNSHPGEIAHGVALGVIMGMMPKDNALWYILFVFFFFIRIKRNELEEMNESRRGILVESEKWIGK